MKLVNNSGNVNKTKESSIVLGCILAICHQLWMLVVHYTIQIMSVCNTFGTVKLCVARVKKILDSVYNRHAQMNRFTFSLIWSVIEHLFQSTYNSSGCVTTLGSFGDFDR